LLVLLSLVHLGSILDGLSLMSKDVFDVSNLVRILDGLDLMSKDVFDVSNLFVRILMMTIIFVNI
jgi:hypothetical protein